MNNKILFIFEGTKPEKSILNSLQSEFFKDTTFIVSIYNTTIYTLYKLLKEDEYLDLFELLKQFPENKEQLKKYKSTDFSQIFLFFDYDGHASNASNEKLEYMLQFFDDESENGKLYISYPMIEALKDITDEECFRTSTFKIKEGTNYKKLVNSRCLKHLIDFNTYTENEWKFLIGLHLYKAEWLLTSQFNFPTRLINQDHIFEKQMENHIVPFKQIVILSSFPLFIHDYFGNKFTRDFCIVNL